MATQNIDTQQDNSVRWNELIKTVNSLPTNPRVPNPFVSSRGDSPSTPAAPQRSGEGAGRS